MEQSSGDMFEGVRGVMCDPPYETRPIAELSNFLHNRQCLPDMSHSAELFSAMMDGRAHRHQNVIRTIGNKVEDVLNKDDVVEVQ